ncbi:MAG: efflux transporter periplasmic adaptor subunit, partial [Afipia sp.]|nr:efflux transporter periplasmic adaptor subunit [Afipia sp.]
MSRSTIVVLAFAAGAAIFALGLSTTLQRAIGMGPPAKTARLPKPSAPELISSLLSMSDEQIKLAQIDLVDVGPAAIAKRLVVPGSVVPDADRIAHVSVKLSGTVAELRKNIGEDVARDE